jgi:phytoene dehydrogenase-like protein
MKPLAAYDAFIIGSGPNGLCAAITLAQAGLSVLVLEGQPALGGGARSLQLTLPGFTHDICSTVHTLARVSPFLRTLSLAEHGVELIDPPAAFAHPFDDGSAAAVYRSIDETCRTLDPPDAASWRSLFAPLVDDWDDLIKDILAPPHFPRHPIKLARFGLRAGRSIQGLLDRTFTGRRARGLFAGAAAHAVLPFDFLGSAAFGLVLIASAHAADWPIVRGGSQRLADALASILRAHGGEVLTSSPVNNIDDLPPGKPILADITPRQLLKIAGHRLPRRYARRLETYRYGPGAFKMDWALSAPIPWKNELCARAGTVHLGPTAEEISESEHDSWYGQHPGRPYILLVQPSPFDPTRAPPGRHIAWAYCHIPNGSTTDMTGRIEMQIERFAPGFRDIILARSSLAPADLERHNPNLVGGDVNGGAANLSQLFTRPVASLDPYRTPLPGLYLCSASTPPGGGVHGMCGHHAAQSVLRRIK